MNRFIVCLMASLILILGVSPGELDAKASMPTPPSPTQAQYKKLLQIAPVVSEGQVRQITSIAWEPDGKSLAVVYGGENIIRILNAETGDIKFTIEVPESTFAGKLALAWSPNGKYLAGTFDITFGTTDGVIKVWELSTNSAQLSTTIRRADNRTGLISWSPDGEKLASTHFSPVKESQVLSIWNAHTGELLTAKEDFSIGSWSPDGKQMAVYAFGSGNLQVVDANTFQVISEFPNKTDNPFSRFVAWIDNQTLVGAICARFDICHLWKWNTQTNNLIDKFEQNKYLVIDQLAINYTGNLLTVQEIQSSEVNLWDTRTGKLLNPTIQIKEGYIDFIAWHPSKNILAVGVGDGSLQIWEID